MRRRGDGEREDGDRLRLPLAVDDSASAGGGVGRRTAD